MPNSITIISPVSGETIAASAVMDVSVDYDYVYPSAAYIGGACSAASLHSKTTGPVSGNSNAPAEVGLGTHSGTYTGVEVTARILAYNSWSAGHYCEAAVNNITIADGGSPPPIMTDQPPGFVSARYPYYRVAETGLTPADQTGLWTLDGAPPYKAAANGLKRNWMYDETKDLIVTGKITNAAYFDGSLVAVVSGKLGKTGLIHLHSVPQADIKIDATGKWGLTIRKKVLKKKNAPRQLVITLLDKDEEAVALTSVPLLKE